MKSPQLYYLGVCALLFVIALASGCTGAKNPVSGANFTYESIAKDTHSLQSYKSEMCPIPSLIFNNSQEITKLGNDVGITQLKITGQLEDLPSSRPGTVPFGGVIYHDEGFTRIFDSAGRQILYVNDAESIAYTPGGPVPATFVYGLPDYSQPVDEGDNITYIYAQGNSTCIATIIRAPSGMVKIIS